MRLLSRGNVPPQQKKHPHRRRQENIFKVRGLARVVIPLI
jgi:hypothetical protein